MIDGFVMNKTKLFVKCKFFRKIGWLGFFLIRICGQTLVIEENKHEKTVAVLHFI